MVSNNALRLSAERLAEHDEKHGRFAGMYYCHERNVLLLKQLCSWGDRTADLGAHIQP